MLKYYFITDQIYKIIKRKKNGIPGERNLQKDYSRTSDENSILHLLGAAKEK